MKKDDQPIKRDNAYVYHLDYRILIIWKSTYNLHFFCNNDKLKYSKWKFKNFLKKSFLGFF